MTRVKDVIELLPEWDIPLSLVFLWTLSPLFSICSIVSKVEISLQQLTNTMFAKKSIEDCAIIGELLLLSDLFHHIYVLNTKFRYQLMQKELATAFGFIVMFLSAFIIQLFTSLKILPAHVTNEFYYCYFLSLVPLGFISSYSLFLREPATTPFFTCLRKSIAFTVCLLPLVHVSLLSPSPWFSNTIAVHSFLCLMVLYSDMTIRYIQYVRITEYIRDREENKRRRLIGLHLNLSRSHPKEVSSKSLLLAMNLGANLFQQSYLSHDSIFQETYSGKQNERSIDQPIDFIVNG
jgi:hypothetical protein